MASCKICGFESKTGNIILNIGLVIEHSAKEHNTPSLDTLKKVQNGED